MHIRVWVILVTLHESKPTHIHIMIYRMFVLSWVYKVHPHIAMCKVEIQGC